MEDSELNYQNLFLLPSIRYTKYIRKDRRGIRERCMEGYKSGQDGPSSSSTRETKSEVHNKNGQTLRETFTT